MKDAVYRLFVYGSLRSGFHNPAYGYLSHYFTLVGDAVVRGVLYDNGSFPVAKPMDKDHFINGELYELKNNDEFGWAFGQLDDYEGVSVEKDETPLYKRERTTAWINGQPIETWIYWFAGNIDDMQPLETGDVFKYLQEKNKP